MGQVIVSVEMTIEKTFNVENSALQIVFWRSDKQKFKEYFNKLAPSRNLFTDGKAKVSIDATKGGCGTQQESLTSCNAVCVEAYTACVKDTSYIKELMALARSFKLAFHASIGILQVDKLDNIPCVHMGQV